MFPTHDLSPWNVGLSRFSDLDWNKKSEKPSVERQLALLFREIDTNGDLTAGNPVRCTSTSEHWLILFCHADLRLNHFAYSKLCSHICSYVRNLWTWDLTDWKTLLKFEVCDPLTVRGQQIWNNKVFHISITVLIIKQNISNEWHSYFCSSNQSGRLQRIRQAGPEISSLAIVPKWPNGHSARFIHVFHMSGSWRWVAVVEFG